MRLLWNIIEDILNSEDEDKKINAKLFNDEADALGMDEWEREEARKSGIISEEWMEENEPEHYNNL